MNVDLGCVIMCLKDLEVKVNGKSLPLNKIPVLASGQVQQVGSYGPRASLMW